MKTNTQCKSGLGSRSAQLNTGKPRLARIDFARRQVNRTLDTETLLGLMRGTSPRFFELAEVVGRWVWIQFTEQPAVEVRQKLAQLGFHWNNTRQAWHIRAERFGRRRRASTRARFTAVTSPLM